MAICPGCMRQINTAYCPHCGTALDAQNESFLLPVGTLLKENGSTYRIGKSLGQGGFGVTYIAREESTLRRVAVKEYFPVRCARRSSDGHTVKPIEGQDEVYEGGRFSFLKEARMLASLEGMPSVVQGLAYMEVNNTAYLVMEYLDGTPLYRIVNEKGKMTVDELFPPLRDLMYDIAKLHDRNVIHRDISPDNIMLMPDGSLKLLDFGCARSCEDGKSMTVAMKKGFAPVEQYQSHGQGPWTDVYALAATIYYCLTGVIPPESVTRTLDDTQLKPPIALGAALTPEEENVLMWALAIQAKSRPANMEIFAKHLFPLTQENTHNSTKRVSPAAAAAGAGTDYGSGGAGTSGSNGNGGYAGGSSGSSNSGGSGGYGAGGPESSGSSSGYGQPRRKFSLIEWFLNFFRS